MSEPMICPDCGTRMNFHAEKLVYSEPERSAQTALGLEEIHTCPGCGGVASRAAKEKL